MAITQAMTTSFKAEVMLGVHDFRPSATSGFFLALYTSAATLGAATTAYSDTNEVSGDGYTAGGAQLNSSGVVTSGTTGFVDFADLTFAASTITARGALIYNSTPDAQSNAGGTLTNPAVCVLDFATDRVSTSGDFTIIFPAATADDAIIRIA